MKETWELIYKFCQVLGIIAIWLGIVVTVWIQHKKEEDVLNGYK